MNDILLLGATFDTGNMGVGALASGALTVTSKRYSEATISMLDYGRTPTVSVVRVDGRTISVPLVNLRFSWKVLLANNIAALLALSLLGRSFGPAVHARVINGNDWLRRIAQADVAVAVSGGDSFSDIYGIGRFFYVALPQLLVVSLGVKLIMLPQTIGPFRGATARQIARLLLRRAALVHTRDKANLELARSLVASADRDKVRFCPDMGFVLEPLPPRHLDLDGLERLAPADARPVVGLNVSGLLMMGGYSRSNMFELRLDYAALMDRLVTHFIEDKNANVLLVPHVFGDDDESDTRAMQAVHQRWKERHAARLFRVNGDYDPNEIKHIIGTCQFFVGSRMHACIAALSQAVPAVGVAYSDKFAGVFDGIGAGATVADPRRLTVDEAVRVVSSAFDDRETMRTTLREAMPRIRTQVLHMLDEVE